MSETFIGESDWRGRGLRGRRLDDHIMTLLEGPGRSVGLPGDFIHAYGGRYMIPEGALRRAIWRLFDDGRIAIIFGNVRSRTERTAAQRDGQKLRPLRRDLIMGIETADYQGPEADGRTAEVLHEHYARWERPKPRRRRA